MSGQPTSYSWQVLSIQPTTASSRFPLKTTNRFLSCFTSTGPPACSPLDRVASTSKIELASKLATSIIAYTWSVDGQLAILAYKWCESADVEGFKRQKAIHYKWLGFIIRRLWVHHIYMASYRPSKVAPVFYPVSLFVCLWWVKFCYHGQQTRAS